MLFYFVDRKSIPKFFYKLYQHLRDIDDEVDETDDDHDGFKQPKRLGRFQEMDGITDEHVRIIEECDTIMTFLNNGNYKKGRKMHFVEIFTLDFFFRGRSIGNTLPGYQNETHLSFDLSEVSSHGTKLLLSDLHLFKRRMPEKELGSNLCQITIYVPTFFNG